MPRRREESDPVRRSLVKGILVGGGLLASNALGWAVGQSVKEARPVQAPMDIRAVVKLGCGDSRHVGLVKLGHNIIHPDFMFHIKNAGAAPNEDLKLVIDHLVKEKNLRRDQILVIATSHWNPKCGGAVVDAPAIKQMKRDLADFDFHPDELKHYLKNYGLNEKDVFVSVPKDPRERALQHGRKIYADHGTHVLTGTFDMEGGDFNPLYVTDPRLRQYELVGRDFADTDPMFSHQAPENLLLAVPGTNIRGSPFASHRALQHWTPGESFAVSVNPEHPSARSILSILYQIHLTPKHDGEHDHGHLYRPKLVLAGTKEQLTRLEHFAEKDGAIQKMLKHGFWDPEIVRELRH